MRKAEIIFFAALVVFLANTNLSPQNAKSTEKSSPTANDSSQSPYSGMYSFLKEGEFVQLTVEDAGRVTGFVSRFGDNPSQGPFLNQFFKTGKLDGNKLTFTTEIVRGVFFDFKGTIDRGEGKTPADDAYFVLNGTLTQNTTDANKKVTSQAQDVALKSFPQEPK
jgi:hypothetical protein